MSNTFNSCIIITDIKYGSNLDIPEFSFEKISIWTMKYTFIACFMLQDNGRHLDEVISDKCLMHI